ncbi:MAG: N-6 DNA methylase [Candidatus Omnitrophica bacterium]|nr:N-6 DNA methylase [Candidatus Omnitrophota bacterium]
MPIKVGSGTKKPDVVYYWDKVPLVLIEAKKEGQSEENAKEQALSYVRNFPTNNPNYSKDGRRPRFVITTVAKNINFYIYRFEVAGQDFKDWLEKLDIALPFSDVLSHYGLSSGYRPAVLTPQDFSKEFLNELMAIYKLKKLITKDVIFNVASQILSYLENPKNYTSRHPYVSLDSYKDRQSHVRQLLGQYDLLGSLNSDNAREFRRFVLRSFQGTNLNQYMTEQCVIAFMVNLVNIKLTWKVLDFECGSGGFLSAVIDKGNIGLNNITGIDIDSLPYVIAKTYLAIYFGCFGKDNIDSIPVYCRNGLFYYGNDWDLVIGNPSGSNKYPNEERKDIDKVLANLETDLDLNGRSDSFSEYNFSIQQAIRSAKVGGRICLILPEGFFSNSQDEILRKYVAKHCKVLAIISLPRGVFKVGTDVQQAQRGSRTASMKMSILYVGKIRAVKDKEGLNLSDINLDYPVFLASINLPESTKGPVCEWLDDYLGIVSKQWESWQKNQVLTDPGEIKYKSLKKVIEKKKRKRERQKLLIDIEMKEKELPKYEQKIIAKTKISTALKGIFGKKKK